MKTIKVLVDGTRYTEKPVDYQIGQLKKRFGNSNCPKDLTIDELFKCIENGQTFVPGVLIGGNKDENWIQQQLIAVDVDNDEKVILPQDAIKLLKESGIEVLGYYHTFNSTQEHPRYRLLLLLDKEETEKNKVKFIIETLTSFVHGDKACKDLSRMFYGTNGEKQDVVLLNPEATITLDDVIKLSYKNQNKEMVDYGELSTLIRDFDLLSEMKKDNEVARETEDIVYFKDCSICGHKDCLRYYKKTNTFNCFGANGSVGGSIIDYLMATKNMSKAEAINHFKYDIKGLPKNEVGTINKDTSYLSLVQKQVARLGYSLDFVNEANFDWVISNASGKCHIDCPNLYFFIANNVYYIFAKQGAKSGILRYFYLENYYKLVSEDEMKGIIKEFIPIPLQKSKDINEVYHLLCTDRKFKEQKDLNSDENIIVFNNGVLKLDTGKLEKHSPKYLSTIKIPCDYIEEAPHPKTSYFDDYINTLTSGDEDIKKLILQIAGVTISNIKGYRMKKCLILIGEGNTGKSQIKIFLTRLIGSENTSNIGLESLEDRFGKINLLNKRLAGSNDMSFAKIKQLEVFKQAVAGDPIHAEFKGENGIDFVFNGILWFCTNEYPKFGGDKGEWVYDRFILVRCDNVISEKDMDKHLVEHLLEEKEYVVSLMIKSLKQVINNGYKYDIPKSSYDLLEEYKTENSTFRTFLKECCTTRDGSTIKDNCTKGKIYKVYRKWCQENCRGYYFDTKSEVKKILDEMGLSETINTNKGNEYYTNITLTDKAKKEYYEILGEYRYTGEEISAISIPKHIDGVEDDNYDF